MKFALHGVGSGSTVKPEPLAQVAPRFEGRFHRFPRSASIPSRCRSRLRPSSSPHSPEIVPRSRFDSDLFPALERFAQETMAASRSD